MSAATANNSSSNGAQTKRDNSIRFSHLRSVRGNQRRVLTIARRFNKLTKTLRVAYCLCSSKDVFKKKRGCDITTARLEREGKYFVAQVGDNENPRDVALQLVASLGNDEGAKKIAQDYQRAYELNAKWEQLLKQCHCDSCNGESCQSSYDDDGGVPF